MANRPVPQRIRRHVRTQTEFRSSEGEMAVRRGGRHGIIQKPSTRSMTVPKPIMKIVVLSMT
jgi:hypothetical protein